MKLTLLCLVLSPIVTLAQGSFTWSLNPTANDPVSSANNAYLEFHTTGLQFVATGATSVGFFNNATTVPSDSPLPMTVGTTVEGITLVSASDYSYTFQWDAALNTTFGTGQALSFTTDDAFGSQSGVSFTGSGSTVASDSSLDGDNNLTGGFSSEPSQVPEPTVFSLALMGLGCYLLRRLVPSIRPLGWVLESSQRVVSSQ